jgi:hypothetical protein
MMIGDPVMMDVDLPNLILKSRPLKLVVPSDVAMFVVHVDWSLIFGNRVLNNFHQSN